MPKPLNNSHGISFRLDASDEPHLAYYRHGYGELWYATLNGGQWNLQLVDAGMEFYSVSLDLDADGRPHLAYSIYAQNGQVHALRYAALIDGAWLREDVLSDPAPRPHLIRLLVAGGGGADPEFDEEKVIHIAFAQFSGGLQIVSSSEDGWTTEEVDSYPMQLALTTTSTGALAMAYSTLVEPAETDSRLAYALRREGTWQVHTIKTWLAHVIPEPPLQLAIDAADRPHVLYGKNTPSPVVHYTVGNGCL
jgi:hypothetical protein